MSMAFTFFCRVYTTYIHKQQLRKTMGDHLLPVARFLVFYPGAYCCLFFLSQIEQQFFLRCAKRLSFGRAFNFRFQTIVEGRKSLSGTFLYYVLLYERSSM